MVSRLSLLALAGTLALAGSAHATDTQAADEVRPLDARVVALGEGSAVVYYTHGPEGADVVHVVTTVATDPEGAAAPARFVSHLSPGQKAEVSVAGAVGTEPASLELAYDGGLLTVRPVSREDHGS
jgi:hypothetical protein